MTTQEAIEILRAHFSKSSAHRWKDLEQALDVIEKNINFDSKLNTFYFDIEKAYHDLHAPLSD
jgi:hypothetical protein